MEPPKSDSVPLKTFRTTSLLGPSSPKLVVSWRTHTDFGYVVVTSLAIETFHKFQERKLLVKKIGCLSQRVNEAHVRNSVSPDKTSTDNNGKAVSPDLQGSLVHAGVQCTLQEEGDALSSSGPGAISDVLSQARIFPTHGYKTLKTMYNVHPK